MRSASRGDDGFGSPAGGRLASHPQVLLTPPPLIQKRFISDISHVETQTLNLILDPPLTSTANAVFDQPRD